MYAQVEKPKADERRVVANSVAQKKGNERQKFEFVDNRPETIAQRTLQRYTVHDQYMVSENKKFAVRAHGTPQSQMFVHPGSVGDVATLNHIEFEKGAQVVIDSSNYLRLHPKYKSEKDKAEMERMYCGKFSIHVTEKSGDAPKGKSLYMQIKGPASAWENHYAPVILEDGGDRGTFETAFGFDYIFFGIYGQEVEQSFEFKTEIAGMALGLQNNALLPVLESQRNEQLMKGRDVTRITWDINNMKKERAAAQKLLTEFQQGGSNEWGQSERQKATVIMQQIQESHKQRLALEAEMREQEKADRERRERNAKLMKIGTLTMIILAGLGILLAMNNR